MWNSEYQNLSQVILYSYPLVSCLKTKYSRSLNFLLHIYFGVTGIHLGYSDLMITSSLTGVKILIATALSSPTLVE